VRYAFIEQHRDSYPLQTLCAALEVSDSGFASWQRGEGPTKWLSDGTLLKLICEIHVRIPLKLTSDSDRI
jgi:putative transposase